MGREYMTIYMKHFTHDEVRGLLAFYSTDLGKKLIVSTPLMVQEGATLAQNGLRSKRPDSPRCLRRGFAPRDSSSSLARMKEIRDRWAAAQAYEAFMGRWSRLLATRFVSWLGVPDGAHWLDVGCGTGAMTSAICAHASPSWVVGCDPAAPFIEYARKHVQDSRATFVVGGIDSLLPPHRHPWFRS